MTLTTEHIEQRTYWADHLMGEHGIDWPQGTGDLCNEGGYCCLGVAAALGLADPQGDDEEWNPSMIEATMGYGDGDLSHFVDFNDRCKLTFDEIAEIIHLSCEPRHAGMDILDIASEYGYIGGEE